MNAVIGGVCLAVLVLAGLVAWRLRNAAVALVLAAVSGIWLVANKSLEGPVLLPITPNHGLTFSDLFGFVGLYFAVRIIWRQPIPQHQPRSRYRTYLPAAAAVALFAVSPVIGLFR